MSEVTAAGRLVVESGGITWTIEHLYRVFHEDLDLCGCGNPEDAWRLIHDVLALAPFYQDGRSRDVEDRIGSDGATHFVLSALTNADLLEHGGSLGGSWLTDRGRWYLAVSSNLSYDDLDEYGSPHRGQPCTDECRAAMRVPDVA